MISLSQFDISSTIKHLGLLKKYPVLKKHKYFLYDYITKELYCPILGPKEIAVEISHNLIKQNMNLDLVISNICKRNKHNTSAFIHRCQVYHKKNINDFLATKYICGFFSSSIELILKEFDFANQKNKIPEQIQTEELSNIFDIALIVQLANIFSRLEFFINAKCIKFLSNRCLQSSFIILLGIIIKHEEPDLELTYEYLFEKYPDEIHRIITKIESESNIENKLISILNACTSLYYKSINIINNKSNEEISSDINIRSICGNKLSVQHIKYNYKNMERLFGAFFKHHVISTSIIKCNDIFAPRILPNLIIPKQPSKSTKQIIIEL